ncbi:hypothetical protein BC941DRAFT_412269 [Chlamydoabsidia padenii]|nr:hypothetical protein BC941DRAFT_412269 [Chlamydoabsidia padenii]
MTSHTNQSIWDNINSWKKDISQKDALLDKRKPVCDPVHPPIRKPIDFNFDQKKPVGLNALKSNVKTSTIRTSKTQEKAQIAKEKGNTCFQQQQYQQAIRHYSEAIDLDPTNAIYFVNRAMAHLKLKNYLQVEQDCTKCLGLQPNHVKALWRRGMALQALGRSKEARKDFEQALQIEPGNKLIIEELGKLGPVSKDKVKLQPTASKESSSIRTLDIKVIDEAYLPDTSNKNTPTSIEKVQTATLTTNIPTASAAPGAPAVHTSPITPTKPTPAPSGTPTPPTATSASLPPLKLTCPRTNYEFERDWKACKRRGDDVIYQYLQCIPPTSYATLFKSSLEPDQFEKMIDIVHRYYLRDKTDTEVLQILQGLGQIGRLDMLVMFLDKKSKQVLETIFSKLTPQTPKSILLPLANRFSVKIHQ